MSEELTLKTTPPTRCNSCGTKTKNMKVGWLMFPSSADGVVLLACPNCHAVYTNVEAQHNTDKILEFYEKQKEKRIITLNN